jgi:hypothetical protein
VSARASELPPDVLDHAGQVITNLNQRHQFSEYGWTAAPAEEGI